MCRHGRPGRVPRHQGTLGSEQVAVTLIGVPPHSDFARVGAGSMARGAEDPALGQGHPGRRRRLIAGEL